MYETKNIAAIVVDSTVFCPTRFNKGAAQGVRIANRLGYGLAYSLL